jgi:O-antigen ligase
LEKAMIQVAYRRIGPQGLGGLAVGVGVALLYVVWNTWGQLAMVAAGLCALPLVAIIVRYPMIGVAAVVFLVAVIPTTMMPMAPMIILLVTLFGVVVRKVLTSDLTWRTTNFFVWSSLLFLWLGISVAWVSSYDFVGSVGNYYPFLIMLVFGEVVRTPADLRRVGLAAALGMVVAGATVAYGFYELVTSGAMFKVAGAVQNLKGARFYGLWNTPNSLAYTMMAFVPLILLFSDQRSRRAYRLFLVTATFIGLTIIVLTLTRGAWLCTALMLTLAIRYYRKRWVAAIMIVLAVVIFSVLLPVNMLDRAQTLVQGRKDASLGERGVLLRSGIEMVEDSFPFGHGAGATIRQSTDYAIHRLSPIGTHNSYLDALVEGGLVGGVLLVGTIVSLFASLWRRFQTSAERNERTRGILMSGLVAIVIGMAFENVIGFPAFWIYFTMISLYPIVSAQMTSETNLAVEPVSETGTASPRG